MSRRTLRGAIPTTDNVLASGRVERSTTEPGAPGPDGTAVDTDAILLRGPEAARARRLDLVGDRELVGMASDLAGLDAVGPWAEHLDDAREQARSSGFQQGRQEGLSAGLQASRDQVERERAELGRLVESAVEALEAGCEELGEHLSAQTVDLAIGIARAVLDREIAFTEDPGAEAIARCLDLVPDQGCLVVRLNPDDLERLGPVPGLGDRELSVTADPTLGPGDAIVTVDQVTIDARLSEALRRVEEALR